MLRRKLRNLTFLSGLGGALFAMPPAVEARQFEPATLRWVRTQDADVCPGEWEIARAVEARLGPGALVPPASATLVVEASIRARPEGGFQVDIALLRGNSVIGRRELSSAEPNCSSLAEQAALVIALTIDPEASPLAPPQEAPPEPPVVTVERAPSVASPPRTTPSAAPRKAPARPHWEGDLEIAAGFATGIVPETAPGVFLRGRGRPPGFAFAIELESGYFPPTELELESGQSAHFALLYLGAALCNKARRGARLRLSLCVGPDVAATTGQAHGFDRTPRFWSYTLALSARGRLGFRVARGLALVLGPDIMIPFRRDSFVAITEQGTEESFRMKPMGFGFELGGVWEL
jgi:hypothetical protein